MRMEPLTTEAMLSEITSPAVECRRNLSTSCLQTKLLSLCAAVKSGVGVEQLDWKSKSDGIDVVVDRVVDRVDEEERSSRGTSIEEWFSKEAWKWSLAMAEWKIGR